MHGLMFFLVALASVSVSSGRATAADGGSLLVSLRIGDAPNLISAISSRNPPSELTGAIPGLWTFDSIDGTGKVLWSRPLATRRTLRSIPDRGEIVTASIDRPTPGSTLRLLDHDGIMQWHGTVDGAFLAAADARGAISADTPGRLPRPARVDTAHDHSASSNAEPSRREAKHQAVIGPEDPGPQRPQQLRQRRTALVERLATGMTRPDMHADPAPGDRSWRQDMVKVGATPSTGTNRLSASDGWVIEATLVDAATGLPIRSTPAGSVHSIEASVQGTYEIEGTAGRIRFVVPREPDAVYEAGLTGLAGFSSVVSLRIGPVEGNQTLTIPVRPAHSASVRLEVEGGQVLPGGRAHVQCYSSRYRAAVRYSGDAIADANGIGRMELPYGEAFTCSSYLEQTTLAFSRENVVFSSARPEALVLPATTESTLILRTSSGAILGGEFQATWNVDRASAECRANPCRLSIPRDREVSVYFNFFDGRMFKDAWLPAQRFLPGSTHSVVLHELFRVEGNFALSGEPRTIQVRAFDAASGRFVQSSPAYGTEGRFRLLLPKGRYVLETEILAYDVYGDRAFNASPQRTPPIDVVTHREVPPITIAETTGELVVSATVPCSPPGTYTYDVPARVALTKADGTRVVRTVLGEPPLPSNGRCINRYRIRAHADAYAIEFSPLGWFPRALGTVHVAHGQTTEIPLDFSANDRSLVWRGVLRTAGGSPIDNAWMDLYDEVLDNRTSWLTSASGAFEIPFQPGWTLEVAPPSRHDQRLMSHVQQMGISPPPALLTLKTFPDAESREGDLLRIYGNGDRQGRVNVLFLAEGFTSTRESFTDQNGNGQWDGVVWYDLDRNGVLNTPSDLVQPYGDAAYPMEGTVPTAGNEPFVDLNGDGYPNLDDRATFLANSKEFLRSLLGSDFWNMNTDALNAYALFTESAQAGFSVAPTAQRPGLARSTRYGSRFFNEQLFVPGLDDALTDAAAALPEVDIVVVVVNETVRTLRSSTGFGNPGWVVFAAGPLEKGDYPVAAYLFSHAIANLCSEHSSIIDFPPSVLAAARACPNASYSAELDRIPWLHALSTSTAIPTRSVDDATGLFEGATYYAAGTYRPSLRSMMRDLTPLFNVPSLEALKASVEARTGPRRLPAEARGRCMNAPLNSVHHRAGAC